MPELIIAETCPARPLNFGGKITKGGLPVVTVTDAAAQDQAVVFR